MARATPRAPVLAPATLEALTWTIDWRRRGGDHDGRIETLEQRGNRVVVTISWADKRGRRHDWAHVLKLKHGKIVDMQDYKSSKRAAAAARLRTALS